MKAFFRLSFLALIVLTVCQESYAYKNIWEKHTIVKSATAGCAPGAGFTDLWVNNVRCRINTGGDMWWDLQGVAKYFIPGNTLKTSMFSAALWIGGIDANGQLKLAAQRYRSGPSSGGGVDFWPGPLTTDVNAAIDAQTCSDYDRLFRIKKTDVQDFIRWKKDPQSMPDYSVPESIKSYPGNGDETKHQSPFLAPFKDVNGDGFYNPTDGDYPYYDFSNELCKANLPTAETQNGIVIGGILADQVLKGDETLWWVFNDKGNLHTETQGSAIGLEIRAQAFGFSTNDEINSMTFYSYEIVNRSAYPLTETYFSQWTDTDVGYAWDDYVGCDVKRGLGYCYNGREVDGQGQADAYGDQPPAVGVDFFQGPYMDPHGCDVPSYNGDGILGPSFHGSCDLVSLDGNEIPMTYGKNNEFSGVFKIDAAAINGVNFGDGIPDNERFGMRRFVYHINQASGPTSDPKTAPQYYALLRGIWQDGQTMKYGGNAHPGPGSTQPDCDFMFPELSDPCNWGTQGKQPPGYHTGGGTNGAGKIWTEKNEGNAPGDRRFMHSAGPFTLQPGAVNYITVGIPWARASSGGAWASVELLKVVDDKCQKLFDNCFQVLQGPNHPDLIIQELDRTVIVYLKNVDFGGAKGDNFHENYQEVDPNIITPDSLTINSQGDTIYVPAKIRWDQYYRFQGYQVFQLANASVTDLTDVSQARQVAQCDIKDGISTIINFNYNQELHANVPQKMVDGGDKGLIHSFVFTEDQFASGDKRLINYKQYYYVAVAYAYNNYKTYSEDPNVLHGLLGQKKPYLIGRLHPKVMTGIPHIPSSEANGTVINSNYGDGVKITRVEGQGNGGISLEWTKESVDQLMAKTEAPYIVENPTYKNAAGPLNVKVIDPLSVKPGNFVVKFVVPNNTINNATWVMLNEATGDTVAKSNETISVDNEQLILDYGLSVQIKQVRWPGDTLGYQNGYIESSIQFADSSKIWLYGIPDSDMPGHMNWIRSGTYVDQTNDNNNDWNMQSSSSTATSDPFDPAQNYEQTVNRTFCPYALAASSDQDPAIAPAFLKAKLRKVYKMANLASVNIVITPDKSKWTRCPVIEMCPDASLAEGGSKKFAVRNTPSVDKSGHRADPSSPPSSNVEDPNYIDAVGMGWFPGYAYNLETGERLNMMFGEDSWLAADNGRDMLWNPNSHIFGQQGEPIFCGKHYVYVMAHTYKVADTSGQSPQYDCPAYDAGFFARNLITTNFDESIAMYAYASCMWVGIPYAVPGQAWLSNECTIRMRVSKPYQRYYSITNVGATGTPRNDNWPMYRFTTNDIATTTQDIPVAKSALDLINVVPNPYYGYSGYETDQLDNRVKITNLPEKCTITIYSVNGILVRQISKDATATYIDWDLKNFAGIPIAGGVYIIHINAPGIGEKVVKWFGTLRPVDLNTF